MLNEEIKNNIFKSFGFANEQDFIDRGMSTTDAIRKGIVEFDDEIQKAVYADTYENRKLNRVGQEYHRGKGKQQQPQSGGRKKRASREQLKKEMREFLDKPGMHNAHPDWFAKLNEIKNREGMSTNRMIQIAGSFMGAGQAIEAERHMNRESAKTKLTPQKSKALSSVFNKYWDKALSDDDDAEEICDPTTEVGKKWMNDFCDTIDAFGISKKDIKNYLDSHQDLAEEFPFDEFWDEIQGQKKNKKSDADGGDSDAGEEMLDKIEQNPEKYREALYSIFGDDIKDSVAYYEDEGEDVDWRSVVGDHLANAYETDSKKYNSILKKLQSVK